MKTILSPMGSLLRGQYLLAALLFALALVILYRDVVFEGKTFLMENSIDGTLPVGLGGGPYAYPGASSQPAPLPVRDAGALAWGYEPSSWLGRDLLLNGTLPLWKENAGLGSPFLADGMSLPLEPTLVLSYLIPRRWWPVGVDVLVLARFFLAGWFTYLLARRMGAGFTPAVFSGMAFMLSNQVVAYGNSPQLPAQMLAPLLLYAFDCLASKPSLKPLIGSSLVIAWVIIAGLPEAAFLALMMGGLWYLYRSFWQVKENGFSFPAFRAWFGWGMGAILAGVALSAWYWMPLVENILNSVNNHAPGQGLLTLPPWVMALAILPPIRPLTSIPNFRIALICPAIAGLLVLPRMGKKALAGAFFAGYAIFFGLEMYSIPPFQWIGYLPGYNQVTIPHYMISTVTLSLALLAGLGLDYFSQFRRAWLPLGLAGLLLASAAGSYVGFRLYGADLPGEALQAGLAFVVIFLLLILGVSLLFGLWHKTGFLPPVIMTVLFIEVLFVHSPIERPARYNPYTQPPFISYLKQKKELFRVVGFGDVLYPNTSLAYRIDDLRYLDAIEPARRDLFMKSLLAPGKPVDRVTGQERPFFTGKMLDLLNVRYILSAGDLDPGEGLTLSQMYPLVYDKEIKIYENPAALPRAVIFYQAEQAADLKAAIARLTDPGFDPLATALIEKDFWQPEFGELTAAPWKEAHITSRSSNSLTIQAESQAPGILIVSDTYFPGWQARLDGKPAPIFPVDGLLRGIYLPAGSHQVSMNYLPASFLVGSSISLGVFVIIILASVLRIIYTHIEEN